MFLSSAPSVGHSSSISSSVSVEVRGLPYRPSHPQYRPDVAEAFMRLQGEARDMKARAAHALVFQQNNFRHCAREYEIEARHIAHEEVVAGENRLHEFYGQTHSLLERAADVSLAVHRQEIIDTAFNALSVQQTQLENSAEQYFQHQLVHVEDRFLNSMIQRCRPDMKLFGRRLSVLIMRKHRINFNLH